MFQKSFALISVLGIAAGMFLTTARPAGTALAEPKKEMLAPFALPDLVVSIQAFEKPNKSMSISNGASLTYGGGKPANWFWFTITNKGPVAANNFTYKMVIRNSGIKVYDPAAAQLSLAANGGSKEFGPFQIDLFNHNKIEASIIANIGGYVKESDMSNNLAKLTYKADVAQ